MGGCGAPPLPGAPASKWATISVAAATEIVLQATPSPLAVSIPLAHAASRVLAEDVLAPEPLPPFPASIKVRYA